MGNSASKSSTPAAIVVQPSSQLIIAEVDLLAVPDLAPAALYEKGLEYYQEKNYLAALPYIISSANKGYSFAEYKLQSTKASGNLFMLM